MTAHNPDFSSRWIRVACAVIDRTYNAHSTCYHPAGSALFWNQEMHLENREHGDGWACPLCSHGRHVVAVSGPDYEYASAKGTFTLVQCARCGHVSMDPMPLAEDVFALYPPTYYTVNTASPLHLKGFIYETKIRRDVERIRSHVDLQKLHSIVDIGGGDAARLFELRKFVPRSTECIAFDFRFPEAIAEIAKAADIALVTGNIETEMDGLRDASSDLIIMSQILEHLRDPIAALQQLRNKLTPTGFLILDTPNLGGLDYRLFRERYWGGYHLPRHLHLFTMDSLAEAARRAGYRVVQQGSLPSPGFWITSIRNALGLHSSHWGRSPFEFINFSNLLAVGAFTALDMACIQLGLSTSNQFALLVRDGPPF